MQWADWLLLAAITVILLGVFLWRWCFAPRCNMCDRVLDRARRDKPTCLECFLAIRRWDETRKWEECRLRAEK